MEQQRAIQMRIGKIIFLFEQNKTFILNEHRQNTASDMQ